PTQSNPPVVTNECWGFEPEVGATSGNPHWRKLADGDPLAPSARLGVGAAFSNQPLRNLVPEQLTLCPSGWQSQGASRLQALYPFMYVLPNGDLYDAGRDAIETAKLVMGSTPTWQYTPSSAMRAMSSAARVDAATGTITILKTGGDLRDT